MICKHFLAYIQLNAVQRQEIVLMFKLIIIVYVNILHLKNDSGNTFQTSWETRATDDWESCLMLKNTSLKHPTGKQNFMIDFEKRTDGASFTACSLYESNSLAMHNSKGLRDTVFLSTYANKRWTKSINKRWGKYMKRQCSSQQQFPFTVLLSGERYRSVCCPDAVTLRGSSVHKITWDTLRANTGSCGRSLLFISICCDDGATICLKTRQEIYLTTDIK